MIHPFHRLFDDGAFVQLLRHEMGGGPDQLHTAIAARGDRAYVGRSTNGGELVVLDVANPANPCLLYTSRCV